MLKINILLFCIFSTFTAIAQIHPFNNDTINYRLAGFSVPANNKADFYKLQVANGVINNNSDFSANIIIDSIYTQNNMLTLLPEYGKSYTWRVEYLNNIKRTQESSPLYHVTTGYAAITDTAINRMNIVQHAEHHTGLMVFIDQSKALYNLNGEVMWYLPPIKGISPRHLPIRDLKITPFGTLTFLAAGNLYEVDYDGNLLWTSAKTTNSQGLDSFDTYHHEFTRLSNGHYMAAGNEHVLIPLYIDSAEAIKRHIPMMHVENGIVSRQVPLGTLEEFDEKGNIVWRWESSKYIKDDSLFFKRLPVSPDDVTPYMNSFYLDEKENVIYISFKNAHHVIKISYPDGALLASYYGLSETPPLFAGQHAARLNNAGNLVIFNNNRKGDVHNSPDHISYLTELKEENGKVKKIWEFSCKIDSFAKSGTSTGGNILQMQDGCYLACVGSTGRVFIVNEHKKMIWNAILQKKDERNVWWPDEGYRTSPLQEPEQIEKLIFPPAVHKE